MGARAPNFEDESFDLVYSCHKKPQLARPLLNLAPVSCRAWDEKGLQMKPPQVSIIVPALNAQAYIGTALESALSQTCSEIEVIAVDDGSSDGTADEMRRFAALDSRLRLIRHSSTRGVSAARNTGIAAAQGKWLAPLDADDAFALNRIEYLLKAVDETTADLIADNLMLCSFPSRQPLEPAVRPESPLFASPLTLLDFVAHESIDGNVTLGQLKPLLRRRFI
jgi:succinoglycan biosynthesis protein ExoO